MATKKKAPSNKPRKRTRPEPVNLARAWCVFFGLSEALITPTFLDVIAKAKTEDEKRKLIRDRADMAKAVKEFALSRPGLTVDELVRQLEGREAPDTGGLTLEDVVKALTPCHDTVNGKPCER